MKTKGFEQRTAEVLARLGISEPPPAISAASNQNEVEHRGNCLAWHLLCTKTRQEINAWLKRQSVRTATDMRVRLNRLRQEVQQQRDRESAAR